LQPEASREVKKIKYVDVDISKSKCRAAVTNPEGVLINEFAFNNDHAGIEELASRLTPEDRLVMESTGSVWSNLYDILGERHVPVVLANPLKTRAIVSARIKTDKVDAARAAQETYVDRKLRCHGDARMCGLYGMRMASERMNSLAERPEQGQGATWGWR